MEPALPNDIKMLRVALASGIRYKGSPGQTSAMNTVRHDCGGSTNTPMIPGLVALRIQATVAGRKSSTILRHVDTGIALLKQPKLPVLKLKPGREGSLLRRHPWIFSGAVSEPSLSLAPGSLVRVVSAEDVPLAIAYFNGQSQIIARALQYGSHDDLAGDFVEQTLRAAIQWRKHLGFLLQPRAACRLFNAEADGIPGLVIDRYADVIVLQSNTAGVDVLLSQVVAAIKSLLSPKMIYERSDENGRELEGLPPRCGVLHGSGATQIECEQDGLMFAVDIERGHKTGTYLDQCDNRRLLTDQLCADRDVLNCFAYTGGFSLAALRSGARSVVSVDSSQPALDRIAENISLNNFALQKNQNVCSNVFEYLRACRDRAQSFDVIVMDPPKLCHAASQIEKASKAYKDLNLLAWKLLRPGGWLMTYSCSGHISADLFQKIIFGAASDVGCDARISQFLRQSHDHAILLSFPQSFYLKGLLCQKV